MQVRVEIAKIETTSRTTGTSLLTTSALCIIKSVTGCP